MRRTLQLAEVLKNGDPRVLLQLDVAKDTLLTVAQPTRTLETLQLYTGLNTEDIRKDLSEKARILKWMVKQNITDVHQIGVLMAKYYSGQLLVDDVIKA
ncbi:MAG: hypothetical protein EPN86_03295 [Nanoarchaeota archaeon]|nr:MAG: hypothetical protein EPN86_03295 [Nanoarchaeota archaeon]